MMGRCAKNVYTCLRFSNHRDAGWQISKFRANAGAVLSKEEQDKVIDLTWRFDELEEISEYMGLLR